VQAQRPSAAIVFHIFSVWWQLPQLHTGTRLLVLAQAMQSQQLLPQVPQRRHTPAAAAARVQSTTQPINDAYAFALQTLTPVKKNTHKQRPLWK
jgi:hypothetical protein